MPRAQLAPQAGTARRAHSIDECAATAVAAAAAAGRRGVAQFYVRSRVPFVMGTTGGDRDRLVRTTDGRTALPPFCWHRA